MNYKEVLSNLRKRFDIEDNTAFNQRCRARFLVMNSEGARVTDVESPTEPSKVMDESSGVVVGRGIDKARSRYPYCIVWTPLPLITWFIPIIGKEYS